MNYTISSYLLPSRSHRAFPFQEPDLAYKHIRPEGKPFLVSVMAYVPGSKPAADLITDAVENFFAPDIIEDLSRVDSETLAAATDKFITENANWFFRHNGMAISDAEYAVLILNLDTGTFVSFSKGDCIICKGPVDSPAAFCEPADCEEGIFTADTCFLVANSTVKHIAQESLVLSEVICRAMCLKNDEEYLDIAAEAVTEVETPSRLIDKQDAFLAFIPVYKE